MRKASTRLPEQGTQTPSPAPDLIPAEPKNQLRTHIAIGTANGGTSTCWYADFQPMTLKIQCTRGHISVIFGSISFTYDLSTGPGGCVSLVVLEFGAR
jgi:hypothetical protein